MVNIAAGPAREARVGAKFPGTTPQPASPPAADADVLKNERRQALEGASEFIPQKAPPRRAQQGDSGQSGQKDPPRMREGQLEIEIRSES